MGCCFGLSCFRRAAPQRSASSVQNSTDPDDSTEKGAQIDKLLEEGRGAYLAEDYRKANDIAKKIRKLSPGSLRKNDAQKLYLESRQKLKIQRS